jgi:uncharacterized UPF0160 family protein
MSFLKSITEKKKLLVTHDSTFHADDIFATATLSLLLDGNIDVVRTRDEEMIKNADYVYDVGGEYDPARNRFDHHQKGGAGNRENGIPYAAFGLVWKTYGATVCGSAEVAPKIDESLVQSIDAEDNGVNSYTLIGEAKPYVIQGVINAFRPTWKEEENFDAPFMELVEFFKKFLMRKIKKAEDAIEAESFIKKAYDEAPDKRLIVLEDQYPWRSTFMEYSEPLYVVVPKAAKWHVYCVQKEEGSYENRKSFPESWAGLRDEDLASVTGVPDAIFCHNGRFLAVAKSKEGAMALAEIALNS